MTRRTLYVQLIIAFMCVAMVAYLVMLGRVAVAMIGSGRAGLLAAFSETRPMRCSLPCAPSSKTTPTTGAAGTDWRAPTTTRGIGAARGKR